MKEGNSRMLEEDTTVDTSDQTGPAGDEDTNTPPAEGDTPPVDWKSMSRKHEDRAKRLQHQLDALKPKAALADEASSRADAAEAELARLRAQLAEKDRAILVAEVAQAKGVPADRIRGTTREEMEADADDLARLLSASHQPSGATLVGVVPAAGTGRPQTNVTDVEAARARARQYLGIKNQAP